MENEDTIIETQLKKKHSENELEAKEKKGSKKSKHEMVRTYATDLTHLFIYVLTCGLFNDAANN
jgi:hypothetical protein